MSLKQLVILDFDGTCTDVEEEGRGFVTALIGTLAKMTGQPPAVIAAWYEEFEERLRQEADKHGWVVDGLTVAPAIVDPYLRSKPIQRWILKRAVVSGREIALRIAELNGPLFGEHYAKSGVALREFLPDVLNALGADPETAVAFVTNSGTEAVKRKLATLNLGWEPRVIGDAKKYVAEPGLEAFIPGLRRGIQLRRPHYRTVLESMMREYRVTSDRVTVIGDIYELDLAVPDHLGMRTALMLGPNTPAYERIYMETSDHRRRGVVHNLGEALGFIRSAAY